MKLSGPTYLGKEEGGGEEGGGERVVHAIGDGVVYVITGGKGERGEGRERGRKGRVKKRSKQAK